MGVKVGGFQPEIHGEVDRRDPVLPSLELLRKNNTVSNRVNQLWYFMNRKADMKSFKVGGHQPKM